MKWYKKLAVLVLLAPLTACADGDMDPPPNIHTEFNRCMELAVKNNTLASDWQEKKTWLQKQNDSQRTAGVERAKSFHKKMLSKYGEDMGTLPEFNFVACYEKATTLAEQQFCQNRKKFLADQKARQKHDLKLLAETTWKG